MTGIEEFFIKAKENGFLVSGGYAVQHYLPDHLRSKDHDDIDLIYINKDGNYQDLINGFGIETPYIIKDDQPRRKVYETYDLIDGIKEYIHIEITDLNVPSSPTILRNGLNKRIIINLPTIDYLIARLIYGAGSITRPHNRELDDIAYLCDLTRFCSDKIDRNRCIYYLEKLAGGKSRAEQIRANLRYELSKVDLKDVIIRQKKRVMGGSVETNEPHITVEELKRYTEDLFRLSNRFGVNGIPQREHLDFKRRLHRLTTNERKPLAIKHDTNETEAGIWRKLTRFSAEELRYPNKILG